MTTLHFFSMLLLVLTANAADPEPPKVVHAKGTCIVNGSYIDHGGWFFYNGPAYKLEEGSSLYRLIYSYCPQYILRGEVCCTQEATEDQFTKIKQLLDLFAPCNACRKNILQHFCATVCDPDQSLWMDPSPYLKYREDEFGFHTWYVTAVDWYVTNTYADDFFDSCVNVKYLQGNNQILKYVYGGDTVHDPLTWLDFLNKFIQFDTFFKIGSNASSNSMELYSAKIIPCNTEDVNDQCYCADCPATPCKPGPYDHRVMLIIKAQNPTYYNLKPAGVINPKDWTFGPVFNRSVLMEALYLQNNITDMEVPYFDNKSGTTQFVKLSDICYKPMAPDNTNCSIQSALNYFQNSQENLEYVETFLFDFHYHVFYCTRYHYSRTRDIDYGNFKYGISLWPFRNPSSTKDIYFRDKIMSCLGAFGGPIKPGVVLGGVNSKIGEGGYFYDYQNATSLIITIPITSQQTPWSFVWQKAFLEYVGNFKGNYIDVVYYTV